MSSASTRDVAVQAVPMYAYNAKCRSLNLVNSARKPFIDVCIAIYDHARTVGNQLTAESTANRNLRRSFRKMLASSCVPTIFPTMQETEGRQLLPIFPPSRR
jgi:hypothetical protein